MNIICLCEVSQNIGLTVYYFAELKTSLKYLSTTKATICEIVCHKFSSGTITVPEGVDVIVMNEYLQKIQESYLQTSNKDCLIIIRETNHLLLFGLTPLVRHVIAEHEKVKSKLTIAQVELNLQDYQVCAR